MSRGFCELDYNDQHPPRFASCPVPFSLGRWGGSADLLIGNRYGSDSRQRGALDRRYQVFAGGCDRAELGEGWGSLRLLRAEILGLR